MMLEKIRMRLALVVQQLMPGELRAAFRAARLGQPAQVVLAERTGDVAGDLVPFRNRHHWIGRLRQNASHRLVYAAPGHHYIRRACGRQRSFPYNLEALSLSTRGGCPRMPGGAGPPPAAQHADGIGPGPGPDRL